MKPNMNTSILNINTSHPAIRIKLGKAMSINKNVLHVLGNPNNIHFWWSKSERILLIGVAQGKAPLSHEVSDIYYKTRTGFKIRKSNFLQAVMKITGWRQNMIYTVTGEYIAELNMVAFKISDARVLEVESEMETPPDA